MSQCIVSRKMRWRLPHNHSTNLVSSPSSESLGATHWLFLQRGRVCSLFCSPSMHLSSLDVYGYKIPGVAKIHVGTPCYHEDEEAAREKKES